MNGLKLQLPAAAKQIGAMGLLLLAGYLIGSAVVTDAPRLFVLIIAPLLLIVAVLRQKFVLYYFVIADVWFYNYFSYTEKPLLHVGANVYLGDLFIYLFLSSTIIIALSQPGQVGLRSKLGIAIAFYIVWAAICVARGIPFWGHSAVGEARFIIWACLYFPVVYSIRTVAQFERFLRFFLASVLCFVAYSLPMRYLVEFGGDIGVMVRSRFIGADLTLHVVSILVFSFTLLLGGVKRHRMALRILATATGVLIPFGFRTGWVAAVISIPFSLLVNLKRERVRSYLGLLFVLSILVGTFLSLGLFTEGGRMDLSEETGLGFVTETGRTVGSTGWRLRGWGNLLTETLRGNPVFGEGFGSYYDIFEVEFRGVPPHNDWLIIFSKMGVVGLVLFLAVVIQFYRIGFRYIRQSNDVLRATYMRGLLAVFLVGLVGGTFFLFYPFMWIIAGLQTVLVNISSEVPDLKMNLR